MKLAAKNNHNFPTFNSFLNDFFGEELNFVNGGSNMPAVNVKEEDTHFSLEVSAPGRSKEDFNIKIDNKVLTISSELRNESEEKEETGKYTRREFRYGSFERSFTLPNTVEGDKINARYAQGVLYLNLPKREEAQDKGTRSIEIS